MIFKVLYQELPEEVPVRERTKSLYVEAETIREVRKKISDSDHNYNIEFVQPLDEAHLQYEKDTGKLEMENL
ncbi:DNA-dependent RNA polymerase subunit epsilon [Oceanobacillus sp. 1P07AA]|uniref:DNA-dependent RNA polymerase subunit epsilon n=1 Tax=Oceanobacillus sp. 1P07AA TaxID=3132293 RepID=UPI0039A58DC1